MRSYNLYVRPVTRKCSCGSKLPCYSTGEYVRGKWRNVQDVCPECTNNLRHVIRDFEDANKRKVAIIGYHCSVPEFISVLTPVVIWHPRTPRGAFLCNGYATKEECEVLHPNYTATPFVERM